MADTELKDCPFCGNNTASVQDNYRAGNGSMVICPSCTAEGPLCCTETEAADAWNRRSSSSVSDDPRLVALAASDQQVAQAAQDRRDRAARLGIEDAATKAAAPADAPKVLNEFWGVYRKGADGEGWVKEGPYIAQYWPRANAERICLNAEYQPRKLWLIEASAEDAREEVQTDEELRKMWNRAGKEGNAAWAHDTSETNRHTWQLRKFYQAARRASSVPAIPGTGREKGWKLVPELPTLEMQQAALEASRSCKLEVGQPPPLPDNYELWSATYVYRTMLDAAPSHPSEAKAGEPNHE